MVQIQQRHQAGFTATVCQRAAGQHSSKGGQHGQSGDAAVQRGRTSLPQQIQRQRKPQGGIAEQGDDHVQIMDMQIKGQQPGLALVKQPAADSPSGCRGQTFKAGIQNLAVFFGFHQLTQSLDFFGKLQYLSNVQMAALGLGGIQHFLRVRVVQGDGLLADGVHAQIQAFHDHIVVQEGRRADIHRVQIALLSHLRDRAVQRNAPLGGCVSRTGSRIAQRDHGRVFHHLPVGKVNPAHAAAAHNADSQIFHNDLHKRRVLSDTIS